MRKFLIFIFTFLAIETVQARIPGIDLRFKRIELQIGIGVGQYSTKDPYYKIDHKTIPMNYALGIYGGKIEHAWGLTATRGSYFLLGQPRQSFTTVGTYSYRLGWINEKQDYFFIGFSMRTLTYSRDLTLDGVTLDSTNITQLSPGIVITHQKHFKERRVLLFNQLIIDTPVIATEKPTPDLYSQIGASLNTGLMAEVSQHTGVGAELQFRLDRSGTMNGLDRTYMSQFEGSLLARFMYLF